LQGSAKGRDGFFLFSALLETEAHLGEALQRVRGILCGFPKMFCCLSEEAYILERRASFL
jgi:hypothetical protein